ncbi:cystathionine beta-lyase [Granulosicoccus antarcticus]|uniref:Cystathionine beta-lyase MetC n=1 Tax=Granulosicoccus antarcticus IMCC3135 TaxID=1192854 RepID=A0A2Z2NPG5_9GAMM|nr:cystathionine beta-lyase [Granulosicoccus antarcticus]ASJ73163.1 Cystathionine beta-lyase MetC [Granulosicoccus antarcticus IMCC3135]
MSKHTTSIDNTLVQAGRPQPLQTRQVNLPIELGSTVVFDSIEAFEQARDHRYQTGVQYYGRYGNTASFELELMLATLEHAAGVTLTSSGVAAISLTLLALLKPGDHVLVADHVYGNTRAFCDTVLSRMNVTVEYFDPMIGTAIESLFRPETILIMFEAPGSGTFEFPDITGITEVARHAGVWSVLDGTWATPVFCQPLDLGVDVLVYSASKYISGHSDCMMGVIASGDANMHERLRRYVMAIGDKTGAQEVYLALRGLRTLKMRIQAAQASGLEMAQWLAEQPQVKRLLHPALPDCPGHEFWKRDCTGSAGLFGVIFHPCDNEQLREFVNALEHFGIGVSWGGYESLVLPVTPVRTAKSWDEPGKLVRFNIGFEDTDSLKADLLEALPLLNSSN